MDDLFERSRFRVVYRDFRDDVDADGFFQGHFVDGGDGHDDEGVVGHDEDVAPGIFGKGVEEGPGPLLHFGEAFAARVFAVGERLGFVSPPVDPFFPLAFGYAGRTLSDEGVDFERDFQFVGEDLGRFDGPVEIA